MIKNRVILFLIFWVPQLGCTQVDIPEGAVVMVNPKSAVSVTCGVQYIKQQFPEMTFVGPMDLAVAHSEYQKENSLRAKKEEWDVLDSEASTGGCIYRFSHQYEQGFMLVDGGEVVIKISNVNAKPTTP